MIPFFVVTSVLLSVAVVYFVVLFALRWYFEQQYHLTKHKLSDVELLKIISNGNQFMTPDQLGRASALDKKEARNRLMRLNVEYLLRQYYDTTSGMGGVYHLQDDVPSHEGLPASLEGLTDAQVVSLLALHLRDRQVTIPRLMVLFGLEVNEARALLKRLKGSGYLDALFEGVKRVYTLNTPLSHSGSLPRAPQQHYTQNAIPQLVPPIVVDEEQVSDAKVLQLAIASDGRLTPTQLCVRLKIPMNIAKLKLEQLHEQGVMELDVDEEQAIIKYELRDKSLLK